MTRRHQSIQQSIVEEDTGHSTMAPLAPLLVFCACILGFHHAETTADTMSPLDSSFCHGGLEVIYPELDIDKCLIIPKDKKIREKLITVWGAPRVYFSRAQKKQKYVLVMVDPDATSRANPIWAHWRHWLVVNIQGDDLRKGRIQGTTLSDYAPPAPPQKSGFHRYQFRVLEQPADVEPWLSDEEHKSLGKWDVQAFIKRFGLGKPVASLQFLTQYYKD